MSMNKAYSYIRFSSKAQIEGRSLDRQTENASQYASEHGLELQDTSFQDLGVSGFRGKNASEGALGHFMKAVEDGQIEANSWLLIENFDRLTRMPVADALALLMAIVKEGITVVTLIDRKVYNKDSMDMITLMTSLVVMERAFDESNRKSGHLSDVWRVKIANAKDKPTKARLPAWLYYNETKTEIYINETKAKLIQFIYKLSINGLGRTSIVRQLNDAGVPPIGKNTKIWHISYITKILSTRAVLGEYHPHTKTSEGKSVPRCEPISDYYPAIIEESTWLKSQAATALRRQGGTGTLKGGVNKNLFSGLVKCECGSSMNLVTKGTGSKGGNYLVCSLARYGKGCQYIGHRYYSVQWVVLIALQKTLTGFDNDKSDYKNGLKLEGELDDLKTQIKSCVDGIRKHGHSDALHLMVLDMESKKSDIEKELINIQATEAAKTELVDIEELTAKINDQNHRIKLHQYLKRRLQSVTVHKDKHHIDIILKEGAMIQLNQDSSSQEWTDGEGLTFKVTRDTRWG
jgi:hypothetical protein